MFRMNDQKKERGISVLLFSLVSIAYLCLFSLSTSFIYKDSQFGSDSDIFMLMGKLMKRGMIPYKEFFDHKGPVMFFIEYVGQLIWDGRNGIFLIQVVFFMVSLYGTYKILNLFYEKKKSVILTFVSLLILNIYFGAGNFTEEYCFPFLLWSFYFAIKYLRNEKVKSIEHKPIYSLLYGITFMICALTRITNAIPLCIIIIIGFVVMIREKQWKSIIKNLIFFIVGAVIILLPFIIYFIKVDALYEMIYATFLYNIKYALNSDITLGVKDKINQIALIIPLISSLILGICYYIWNKKDRVIGVTVIVLSTIAIIFQLKNLPYEHYFIIWMPLILLAIGIMGNISLISKSSKILITVSVLMSVAIICGKIITKADDIYTNLNSNNAKNYAMESKELASFISEEDLNSVIAYNVDSYFYISTGIKPCYKYCILQDWQCSKAEDMFEEFQKDMESLKAKYIVINKDSSNVLDYVLEENYSEISSTNNLALLQRK